MPCLMLGSLSCSRRPHPEIRRCNEFLWTQIWPRGRFFLGVDAKTAWCHAAATSNDERAFPFGLAENQFEVGDSC